MTTIPAKPSACIALATIAALVFQFGACAASRKPQRVPVTSNPAGARIIIDEREMGTTPLVVSLSKGEDHRVRIEKEGYDPVDMRLISKTESAAAHTAINTGLALILIPVCTFAGVALGWGVARENSVGHKSASTITLFGVGGLLAGAGIVFASAARKDEPWLKPNVIKVTLEKTKASAGVRTNVVVLDRDQLKDIRWIRISCAEGGAEEVVAVN